MRSIEKRLGPKVLYLGVLLTLSIFGVMRILSHVPRDPDTFVKETTILLCKHRIQELEAQLRFAQLNTPKPQLKPEHEARSKKTCQDDFLKTFEQEKRFVCCDLGAGLGNFMFAFASVYGMAAIANKTVVITKNNILLKYFHVKAQVVDDICVCESAKHMQEKHHCSFDNSLLELTEDRNYFPHYYFQSWKYFQHVAEDVRTQFMFSGDIAQKTENLTKTSLNSRYQNAASTTSQAVNLVRVGVHVRKGDITTNEHFVAYGYLTATVQYFKNAMRFYRDKYKHVVFLVCSDDMVWCKANVTGSDVVYIEGNDAITDMAILSACDHSIMSVGTFGWWASFLAGGETIYYKHPVRNGSNLRDQFSEDFKDYFYPGWIGME